MQELKTCMRYVFILSALIICGVFATDWFFTQNGDLLNDTLVGVMIGAPIGWFGAFVAYYTTEKMSDLAKKDSDSDGTTSSGSNP